MAGTSKVLLRFSSEYKCLLHTDLSCNGLESAEADLWSLSTPAVVTWSAAADAGFFLDVYDWDMVTLAIPSSVSTQILLPSKIPLCTNLFPCSLNLDGSNGIVHRTLNGSISCHGSLGCTSVQVYPFISTKHNGKWKNIFFVKVYSSHACLSVGLI